MLKLAGFPSHIVIPLARIYEATNGDARRVMHFLDHRSLDETQKYIDRLIPRAEQENADVMATFERPGAAT